jgi:hypothetical protein
MANNTYDVSGNTNGTKFNTVIQNGTEYNAVGKNKYQGPFK